MSFSVQASQGCASTPAGLVSKWAAEGSAADAAGGNAGTLINSPSFGAGEVGQAFHFDGASQYVKLANSASLNPAGSFSIEAWINYTGISAGQSTIMGKWGGTGDYDSQRSYVFQALTNGSFIFAIADAARQGDGAFQTFLTPAHVLPFNAWTHVAAVYDQSTGTRRIYVNGVNVASRTDAPITVLNSIANAGIGAYLLSSTTPTEFLTGSWTRCPSTAGP